MCCRTALQGKRAADENQDDYFFPALFTSSRQSMSFQSKYTFSGLAYSCIYIIVTSL